MTLAAFHAHILDMGFVFAHIKDILMTREAVAPVRSGRFVRLMTFIAVELHGCIFRPVYLYRPLNCFFVRLKVGDIKRRVCEEFFPVFFVAMAEKTFLRPWSQVCCPVGMAVQACEFFHSRAVHFLALMARQTVSLFEAEFMCPVAVTFCAFDLFYEDMFCVVSGTTDVRRIREFFALFPMAGKTGFPGYDDFAVAW